MSHTLFDKHKSTLEGALAAIRDRGCWSPYPEMPSGKIYGQSAKDDGLAAFKGRLDKPFEIDQPGIVGTVGGEVSPFGPKLGISYPTADLDVLLPAAQASIRPWRDAGVEARTGVCLEILNRLNKRSFEISNAVMHTTGQGSMMSFQAGGPHAQDRGLEAVAYAYEEMIRIPASAIWKKQVGKDAFVTLKKTYRIVPRGVAVVIGCSTFPTWNTYPGFFASLVTGNAVVVKPHHAVILPLAITVETAREVLSESGFDPNLVTLALSDKRIGKDLVTRPEVRIVDYTGASAFGDWIEKNATQAIAFTEKAGVNSIVIDGTDDLKGMAGNIAFSLSLYSGQMCTAPQNIFIPKGGIEAAGEHKTFDQIAGAIVEAVGWLLSDARRGCEILGAIQSQSTVERIAQAAAAGGEVLRRSEPLANEAFPDARVHTPLIMKVDADQSELYSEERFGPIAYVIATADTNESLRKATELARSVGAITWSVYSTDASVLKSAEDACGETGAALSLNLTGQIYVNQAAAFSDFHVSGLNPAGNATLCDAAFVANRFRVVQTRTPVA